MSTAERGCNGGQQPHLFLMVLVAHSVSCARKLPAAWPYLCSTFSFYNGNMTGKKAATPTRVTTGGRDKCRGRSGVVLVVGAEGRVCAHEVSGRDKVALVLVSICKQTVFGSRPRRNVELACSLRRLLRREVLALALVDTVGAKFCSNLTEGTVRHRKRGQHTNSRLYLKPADACIYRAGAGEPQLGWRLLVHDGHGARLLPVAQAAL